MKSELRSGTYKFLKKVFYDFGFNVTITPKPDNKEYAVIIPESAYAPWLSDKGFRKAYVSVREHTLLDEYRLYQLWNLVQQTKEMKTGSYLEVGCWKGGSGAVIGAALNAARIKEKLYLADTFSGCVKAGDEDNEYIGGEHANATQEQVEEACFLTNTQASIIKGVFPDHTSYFVKEKLRFCHIDVDTYKSAKEVFDWVWPKLLRGGIVIFDDYGSYNCQGIKKLVNRLKKEKQAHFIYNLTGQAIMIKK